MKRRDFLCMMTGGVAAAALPGISCALSATSSRARSSDQQLRRKPNVLFIAVDDLRTQLGCYGDKHALTPNIDSLAENGVVFGQAYCQQAVCNPSRASLMTGRRPDTLRVWDLKTHFRETLPDVVTLPQHFKQHGYHAQSIGKIYHDPGRLKDRPSWSVPETLAVTGECGGKYILESNLGNKNVWKAAATECVEAPDNAYIDGRVADAAVETLTQIKDKSFFLAVGFRRPHLPFSAPKKYWDLYEREAVPLAENPFKPIDCPDIALHNWKELRGYTDIPDIGPVSDEKARELIHGYYAATSYTDAQIGRLLSELDRLGLSDNTVVVLWGDHGWHLGEHDLWGKTTNFELDARAPLILSAPGLKNAGITIDALVEFVDVYPTLCDLCDLPIPEGLEGISTVPLLQNPKRPWKLAAFSQFPRGIRAPGQDKDADPRRIMGYSMRTDRYRYTEWIDESSGEAMAEELYDHQNDPKETVNVAGRAENSELVSNLRKKLRAGWTAALPPGMALGKKNQPQRHGGTDKIGKINHRGTKAQRR